MLSVQQTCDRGGRATRVTALAFGFAVTLTASVSAAAETTIDPAVLTAEAARVSVVDRISPTVLCVFSRAGDNGGSGVIISESGEALTNFHVVSGLGPFVKCGTSDGTIHWAVVVGVDPTGDLALIRLLGRDSYPAATPGDSDLAR